MPWGSTVEVRLDQEIGTKASEVGDHRHRGIGAAAGAVLGAVLSGGDLDKVLMGGARGAGGGTAISLGMGETEAVLPSGTPMTLQTTHWVWQGVEIWDGGHAACTGRQWTRVWPDSSAITRCQLAQPSGG